MIEMLDTLIPGEDEEIAAVSPISRATATPFRLGIKPLRPSKPRMRSLSTPNQGAVTNSPFGAMNCSLRSDDSRTRIRSTSKRRASRRTTTDSSRRTISFVRPSRTFGRWVTLLITRCSNTPDEGEVVIDNIAREQNRTADFTGLPHAIFTEPQIGVVGSTEGDLQDENREYDAGRAEFPETAMGNALKLETAS